MIFKCPVCSEELQKENRTLKCINNHCYDISKQGYVNLMMSQKSSKKRHGDDKAMLISRHDFLEKGYYKPLLDALTELILKESSSLSQNLTILDAGCGEGYYTSNIHSKIPSAEMYGIDISKDALIYALKRDKALNLAAASCADISVKNESVDILLNIFSPFFEGEFARVLKTGGKLIRVIPLEDHLFGLKSAVYDKPYRNAPEKLDSEFFDIIGTHEIKYKQIFDNNEDIVSLFKMTPYYYKTSRQDQDKLKSLDRLETEIEFGIILYSKK